MGIRKKGRRKIVCSDKLYIWYVDLDYDSPEYLLNIVAEDKSLILTCPLNEEYPYIVSKGKVFQNQVQSDRHISESLHSPHHFYQLVHLGQ